MTILDWLVDNMRKLKDAGVDSPRRDCLVLLEDLLEKDRSWVIAHADFVLAIEQIKILDKQLSRRVKREPLAYIRGKAWFYGRFFQVTPAVMIPRPESESFIELLKEIKPKTVADIGTGSGCLAISAKLELPETKVSAVDIDQKALSVARKNAGKYKADITFLKGSLLEPMKNVPEVIIANLPYVPDGLISSEEINFEPETALFSGKDGLDHYREFWTKIKTLSGSPVYILTECLLNQHKENTRLAEAAGYRLVKTDILVQQFEPFGS